MVVHTGAKPFSCPICKMGFSTRHGVPRHIKRRHSGVKKKKQKEKILCEICAQEFKHKFQLTKHMRQHTGT